jgi:hypothetical protein
MTGRSAVGSKWKMVIWRQRNHLYTCYSNSGKTMRLSTAAMMLSMERLILPRYVATIQN